MEQRYIANNLPAQALGSTCIELLQAALQKVLEATPPLEKYSEGHLGGLFTGYTGLAYLFLQISAIQPRLQVLGHETLHWARQYLEGDRGSLYLQRGNCGLASEKLSYEAILACITGDISDVVVFLSNIPTLLGPYATATGDPFPSELANGRAGALYLLRMVRHWVPASAPFIESPMLRLAEKIIATDNDGFGHWQWDGTRHFGAGHGDIGIITQIVLSVPSLAAQLSNRLADLIALQLPDGNWPPSESSLRHGKSSGIVQWCHGAPGFISSLQALRPFFPELRQEVDSAIARAQELTWRHGLLIKEPSLCHGILGNAL